MIVPYYWSLREQGRSGVLGSALSMFSAILRDGSQTSADLTTKVHISPSTVQRQLKSLVTARLVPAVQPRAHHPTARYEVSR